MSVDHITALILEYRYWILIPLSFLEGPIIALAAGTLASLGYFNVYFLAGFFFITDLAKDAFYYALGHFGGKTEFVQRTLKKIGVESDHLEKTRLIWEKHPGKTMFFGKLSYGIAASFVVLAGTVGMPLRKFFGWGAFVAITQYGTLLVLGYVYGNTLSSAATSIIVNTIYIIGGIALLGSIYYGITFFIRNKELKELKEAEELS
jgi:membrane-associated protein